MIMFTHGVPTVVHVDGDALAWLVVLMLVCAWAALRLIARPRKHKDPNA